MQDQNEIKKTESVTNTAIDESILPADQAYYEENSSKRMVGGVIGVIIIILIIAGLFSLNTIGGETTKFAEAKQYDDYSTLLKYALAAVTGLTLAYLTAHPTKPKISYVRVDESGAPKQQPAKRKGDNIWIAFIIIGFFFAYLPGIILLAIYMFKNRSAKNPPVGDFNVKKIVGRPIIGTGTLVAFFLVGAIPALILGLIIGYPLSQHACSLSGSKYC